MERLKERLTLTKKALSALDEALKLPYSKIERKQYYTNKELRDNCYAMGQ